MRKLILFHRADLDGQCSGAIAKLANEDAELFGIDYGDEIPWEKIRGAHVIMVDFSLQPWSEMERLGREAIQVTWIDHHVTALELWEGAKNTIDGLWDVNLGPHLAACELTWGHYHGWHNTMPLAVLYLGRYDVWDLDYEPEVLPFQMGMRIGNWDPRCEESLNNWDALLTDENLRVEYVRDFVSRGQDILEYQSQCNERLMSKSFVHTWKGLRFLTVNAGGINSMAFESAFNPEEHDAVMSFFFTGAHWTFSMYSPDQKHDLSVLAQEMGGGVHAHACGFQVSDWSDVISLPLEPSNTDE